MIHRHDEDLHPVRPEPQWQESWYFNWTDQRHHMFGLTRIGFRFARGEIDGVVLAIQNGQPHYLYPAVHLRHEGPWTTHSAAGGIRAGSLVYQMEEPLDRWRLMLFGRGSMDLEWTASTPAFDYHEEGRRPPPDLASAHYEQTGRVKGWTRFRGRQIEIEGLGQRDHSWGARDWGRIEGWNWVSAQFGEGFAFNVWEGFSRGNRTVNGYVFRGGKCRPIESTVLRFEWGSRPHVVRRLGIEIFETSGKRHRISAEALGRFPLVKSGLWIEEVHARFVAEDGGRQRPGIGVVEHAWRAGRLGTLARVGTILDTARHVFFL